MLPPEPQRSRASELKAEVRIPKAKAAKDQKDQKDQIPQTFQTDKDEKDETDQKDPDQNESTAAQLALEALLSARKLRKQSEADRQRLLRQRQRWDKVCENALNTSLNGVNSSKSTAQTECREHVESGEPRAEVPLGVTGATTFWQRHAFGRLSRRTTPCTVNTNTVSAMLSYPLEQEHPDSQGTQRTQRTGTRPGEKSCREMFRRAPAHTTDAVKAVLAVKTPKAAQLVNEQAEMLQDFVEMEGSFDWSSPYALAYNSASAEVSRQEKWEQKRRLPQRREAERTEITYGYDDEDVKLMKASQRLDHEAGGGLGIARRILALKEQGATWQEFLLLAPRAQTTSFEIPKELALQLAVAFAEISHASHSSAEKDRETESSRTTKDDDNDICKARELLRMTAMSMMSSAAARARDADSCEFPLEGLEAIARSGFGWRAFSNMFLAALQAQLQREASDRGSRIALAKDLALRVASVFTWASNTSTTSNTTSNTSNADRADLHAHLSPAGRRVVQAAHDALLDQELCPIAVLELLEMLAVRDTVKVAR